MSKTVDVIAGIALDQKARKSHWPARLDVVQSASGLFIGLFMWGHMAFVSTILISEDTMWWVTKMFEGRFVFDQSYRGIVAAIVVLVRSCSCSTGFWRCANFPLTFRSTGVFAAIERCCATKIRRSVGAGGDRFRAVLFRFRASVPNAHASGRHRPLRIRRSSLQRPLVATVYRASFLCRTSRRHWIVSAGGQVGMVRRRGSQSHAYAAQAAQVGHHRILSSFGFTHFGGLHEDRLRASAPRRRALHSIALSTLGTHRSATVAARKSEL